MMTDYLDYDSDETRSGVGGDYRGDSVDEDTEDASEVEDLNSSYLESTRMDYISSNYDDYHSHQYQRQQQSLMREQAYREKKQQFMDELAALENGTHPFLKQRLELLKKEYNERLFRIECFEESERRRINKDFDDEFEAALREFNDRRIELKESLLQENEEKRKAVDVESIELSYEPTDLKPLTTRKLRRRPNDPVPLPDRRRRASPANILYQIDDDLINDDLKRMSKFLSLSKSKNSSSSISALAESAARLHSLDYDGQNQAEARIEDNKLHYEKKWYLRGQQVILESSEGHKTNASINHVGSNEIIFKKSNESGKIKVLLNDLIHRKFTIRKG